MYTSWWPAILQKIEKTSSENYLWTLLFLFPLLPVVLLLGDAPKKYSDFWVNRKGGGGGHKQSLGRARPPWPPVATALRVRCTLWTPSRRPWHLPSDAHQSQINWEGCKYRPYSTYWGGYSLIIGGIYPPSPGFRHPWLLFTYCILGVVCTVSRGLTLEFAFLEDVDIGVTVYCLCLKTKPSVNLVFYCNYNISIRILGLIFNS